MDPLSSERNSLAKTKTNGRIKLFTQEGIVDYTALLAESFKSWISLGLSMKPWLARMFMR
jgi:hypothetical protein